jgi:hypothetical protein
MCNQLVRTSREPARVSPLVPVAGFYAVEPGTRNPLAEQFADYCWRATLNPVYLTTSRKGN